MCQILPGTGKATRNLTKLLHRKVSEWGQYYGMAGKAIAYHSQHSIFALIQVLVAPLLNHFPVNVPNKATEDEPIAGSPCPCKGCGRHYWLLAQPWVIMVICRVN